MLVYLNSHEATNLRLERARFTREHIANAQIMYSEAYPEFVEADIFDRLESVPFDEDCHGEDCQGIESVRFDSELAYANLWE